MTDFVGSLIGKLGSGSHEKLLSAVTEVLRERNWAVEVEPPVGAMQPDLVARDGEGTTFVVEIKSELPSAFLGAVAQVEAQVDGYRANRDKDVRGVLMFAGEAPAGLGAVADDAGVELVPMSSMRATSVADSLSELSAKSTANGSPAGH
jgi:RecB family endonuclease NucS